MIVRLSGGLGNQFFQYAFGRAYEEKTGEEVSFDTWSFYRDKLRNYELDNYNIKKCKKRFLKRFFCNIVWELKTHIGHTEWLEKFVKMECEAELFMTQIISTEDAYVVGFWQNEDYFSDYLKMIKSELIYNGPISGKQSEIIEKMRSEQSVAMHIRRTDYLSDVGKTIYEKIDKAYYLSALEYLRNRVGDIQVYIFSDDIAWCKNEYSDIENLIFIDDSISTSQHTDMEMMRNCKHFVIANSTFSWWGAWLADYANKIVISPKKWFVDSKINENIMTALMKECILL